MKETAMDREALMAAIESYGRSEYLKGLEDSLAVAERIVGWLTEQPDTARQRRVREMAERAIRNARVRAGLKTG